jgi:hypothetical protein
MTFSFLRFSAPPNPFFARPTDLTSKHEFTNKEQGTMETLPREDSMSIWQEHAQSGFLAARRNAPLGISEITKTLRAGVPSPLKSITANQR